MKYWQTFLLYLGAFVLQPFLIHGIPIVGENLKLILCLTVVLTFLHDDNYHGILFGLIFGLISDLSYGLYLGPTALALVVVGVAIFVLKEFFNVDNFLNVLIVALFSTWLYTSVYWLIYYLVGSPYAYIFATKTLPWQLLFNCLVVVIMYFIMAKNTIKHRRDRYFR